MSISQNFPEEGPTLNLNFAGSRTLDPRITFTRTSSATFMGRDGLVKIAPANSARFDHRYNSTTGEVESLGLLIEESRTNLLLRSEDFSNWTVTNGSVQSNVITAPDGNVTADKLVENSSTGNKEVNRGSITFTSGTSLTYSCFVKAAERSLFRLAATTGFFDSGTQAYFDLTTGTVSLIVGGVTSASIIPYPNGWYRCIATMLPTSSGTGNVFITLISGVSSNYTGDGTSGIYIWGAQLEAGAFPTSYIPTTTSTVTRTADNASITGSNFSDFYNPSEGTIYCSANNNPGVTTTTSRFFYAFERSDGTSADFIRKWIWNGATGLLLNSIYTSNSGPVAAEFNTTLETTNKRTAIAYKQNDFARSYNGSTPSTDNIGNLPVGIDRVRIGTNLSGHIAQLTYYPQRLQNSQLITLTK
jgi:hypothetical protein